MAASPNEINSAKKVNKIGEIDISRQSDFNYFVNKSKMYILNLNDDKMHCEEAKTELNIENAKLKEHMKHVRQNIFASSPLKVIRNRTFADTVHHFQTTQPKKKVFCLYDCYYLVKKSFTEGVQHVKRGETHIYKAIGKPLDIYISDRPLQLKSLRNSYDESNMRPERIPPGETKTLCSDTYYIVIAPCHTVFRKEIISGDGNSTETSPSFATEEDSQVTNVVENRNGLSSNKETNQLNSMSRLSENEAQPSGSRAHQYDNTTHSMELQSFTEPAMVHGSASRGSKRSSTESDRQSKREKSLFSKFKDLHSQMQAALTPPSPSSLRHEVEQISESRSVNGSSDDNCHRAVFAVRRDKNIESYALRPDSTFQVIQDSIMTGSFAIENEDMDPFVIEYHGEVQFIRELARFKNGSTFETTLTVQKDLLNELLDSTRRKEKVIVNYFFEVAFKTIEATYKRFSEMRNTKMIGSCVPAIVPLCDAKFSGVVPDIYEAKP
ncbi:uncharacterized protein LOC129989338 [Argiope bruennichi]|uniref:Uncharacterized protein n=1 Tax=Argiope bruennichi TaxID=94029 RepID=A0A8T0EEF0_ARGBR|nr:uncharacterized protein LOC129989338 [Argiope bruennichi]KAF8771030.1 hypothetical protein HNY73_018491 [Argiope bruennichi]